MFMQPSYAWVVFAHRGRKRNMDTLFMLVYEYIEWQECLTILQNTDMQYLADERRQWPAFRYLDICDLAFFRHSLKKNVRDLLNIRRLVLSYSWKIALVRSSRRRPCFKSFYYTAKKQGGRDDAYFASSVIILHCCLVGSIQLIIC